MASTVRKTRASYDDLLGVPDNFVAEIVDGELHTSPRPASPHAVAATGLDHQLSPFDRGRGGPGGWWILFEPELHLGEDVLVPDLAGWRRERMPTVPSVAFFTLVPDWVCEVVSPGTGRLDRVKKLPAYARAAVPHAWIVDPEARTLEVLRRQGEGWLLAATHGGDEIVRAEPFGAIELDLLALWGEERKPGAP